MDESFVSSAMSSEVVKPVREVNSKTATVVMHWVVVETDWTPFRHSYIERRQSPPSQVSATVSLDTGMAQTGRRFDQTALVACFFSLTAPAVSQSHRRMTTNQVIAMGGSIG